MTDDILKKSTVEINEKSTENAAKLLVNNIQNKGTIIIFSLLNFIYC